MIFYVSSLEYRIDKGIFNGGLVCMVEKAMAPTPVLLPGKCRGWRSLVGCSPWSC